MHIDSLLKDALAQGASDFHMISGNPPFIRIHGQLQPLNKTALKSSDIESMVKTMVDENRVKKFQIEKDLDFAYATPDGTRFRVNIHWEKGNIGLSARTIPIQIPSMEDILMPQVMYDLCNLERGLILVTGPTGCGKTTSLASMIEYINQTRSSNIITLEDPIEFVFKPAKSIIRQRQLGSDMLSFQSGLVHILRQDPNVIMVGEMRNLETIATTITLAETGHLVFATLHTYSAAQTIDRIIDIFPPHQQNQIRMQISLTLKGVISQRLLPMKKGGGRVAAREVMINTPAIANLIRENKIAQIKSTMQTSAKEQMVTMESSLKAMHQEGLISDEVYNENITPYEK
jgi:twitching motility protein PilT